MVTVTAGCITILQAVHNTISFLFNNTTMLPRIFIPDKLHHILFLFSNYLLEYETLTEALQKWMPRFLANSYLALNSVLNQQNVLFFA